jgi:general secretion pathway protein C
MLTNDELKLILDKPIAAKLLCFGLSILIFFLLIKFITSFKDTMNTQVTNSGPYIMNNLPSHSEINKKLEIELFGKYIPKQLGDANIKPSLLDLHVIGIVFSSKKQDSEVIIRFANGIERPFKIGDIIPGGATILHISVDGIIVDREGVLERLKLPNTKLKFDRPPKPLK